MSKGYIEVSHNSMVHNASRPTSFMEVCHEFVESNLRVKDAVTMIEEYGVKFSHYVHSVRSGRIAVFVSETDDCRTSLRLKKFSARKLDKIHSKTH